MMRQSILCWLSLFAVASANLLDNPNVMFSFDLNGQDNSTERSLRSGNAVMAWKGGDKVFATTHDAALHFVSLEAFEPASATVYEPSVLPGTIPECRSGMVLVDQPMVNASNATYLVYAVIDTPTSNDTSPNNISSRLLAVDMDTSLRWSLTIEGEIVGTPLLGQDGNLLYFSHTVAGKGYLSIVRINDNATNAEILATMDPDSDRTVPLSPAAMRQYHATLTQTVVDGDVVVVAENWDEGYTATGRMYILMKSTTEEDAFEFILASRSSWTNSAIMAPLFVGDALWIGGTAANLVSWSQNKDLTELLENRREDITSNWRLQLPTNASDESQPLRSTPALSSRGGAMYVSGITSGVHGIQSLRGRLSWTFETDSAVLTSPLVFTADNGDEVLYAIESGSGKVHQIDPDNGEALWEVSCNVVTGLEECEDSVEAEFCLGPSGNMLYYGDVHGKIVGLQVADYTTLAPTAAPTLSPSAMPTSFPTVSKSPTIMPTSSPTVSPTNSPTEAPITVMFPPTSDSGLVSSPGTVDGGDDSPNLGIIIGAVAGGVATLLILILLAFYGGKSTSNKKERDLEVFVEEGDSDFDSGIATEDMDKVAIQHGTDSDTAVEVTAGAHLYKTPKKAKGQKSGKALSPETPATQTSSDGGDYDEEQPSPLVSSDVESISEELSVEQLETGQVGQSRNGHLELSVGNNLLRPLADDASSASEASIEHIPPPPPPLPEPVKPLQEEKKSDDDEEDASYTDYLKSPQPSFDVATTTATLSPQPSFDYGIPTETPGEAPDSPAHSTKSARSFLSAVAAAITGTPSGSQSVASPRPKSDVAPPSGTSSKPTAILSLGEMSPGAHSTDSSLYTDDKSGVVSRPPLSPLSPHVFSEVVDQRNTDQDEAFGVPLLPQSLPPKPSNAFACDETSSDEGGMRAPGTHYIAKTPAPASVRPQFKPSGTAANVKSARTKRTLNSFTPSSMRMSSDEESDGGGKSMDTDQKKTPTFRRRGKKEEELEEEDDTWSSFLNDLADAEKQFFSPTHAQKSAVLRYHQDDDESNITDHADDVTVPTGTN